MLDRPNPVPDVAANGASIPALGLGTWRLEGDVARDIVAEAVRLGYRHFDTAQIYGNETAVGEGLKAGGAPRDQIFLTTKVWIDRFRDDDLQRSAEESCRRLGVDHVDLLLLHWPNAEVPLAETMKALNAVKNHGLTRHIGVSNFPTRELAQAVDLSGAPLVTDQVEFHPFLDQSAVKAACAKHGMALTAYSPIAKGKVVGDETIEAIAKRHGRSAPQVALRWLIQQGVVVIPRTARKERLEENFMLFDFALSDDEMSAMSALGSRGGRLVSLSFAPEWD